MPTMKDDEVRNAVRKNYANVALASGASGC